MNQDAELSLDAALIDYYSLGKEKDRLNQAPLEKERTLRILKKQMPCAPAVVLDIGGAYGVYAFPLAEWGYEVHLIDPIAAHIEQAQEYANSSGSAKLASYSLDDARNINRADSSVDVVLLFGPMYHLMKLQDRLVALKEAYRVLKPGGTLFATSISRFQSFIDNMYKGIIYSKLQVVKHDLITALHKSETSKMLLYFHHPYEFKDELEKGGFKQVSLCGIEGPVWHPGIIETLKQDQKGWEQLLSVLEMVEREETIIGASAHIMGIAKKADAS